MEKRGAMKKLLLVALLIIVSLTIASPANASIFDDLINKVKNIIPQSNSSVSSLTLDSQISFAEDGDVNKNGLFDGGDTLKFTYTINNPTDKDISFATLKTNIYRKYINFIHNVQGSTNLSDNNSTITFSYLRVNAGESLAISFEARVNYFSDSDKNISTQPEILTSDKKSLIKSTKKEIKAKIFKGKIPSNVEFIKRK